MINVLIVEDDPMVAELNKQYLYKVRGFHLVSIARSFNEAISIINEQKINLILLDIYLPGNNGIDLLKAIRKTDKQVDIIIVSAASDISVIKTAMNYGVVDYLIKPFEFERFNKALCSYKETISYIDDKNNLNQDELDNHVLNKKNDSTLTEFPKGLNKLTLMKVWTSIKELGYQTFSTEELSESVGISRVSMRKYLEFLNGLKLLTMEIEYGSVGRPIYQYRCVNSNSTILNVYFDK